MDYQQIETINTEITRTNIQGNPYAEVKERVRGFRKLYPEGFITTEIISDNGERVVMSASCGYYDEKGEPHVLGVGIASEKANSSFINKTSHYENCQTSAIGRAIGFLGIGIDAIASAEELYNAKINQMASAEKVVELKNVLNEEQAEKTMKKFGISRLEAMPETEIDKVIERAKQIKKS